MDTRIESVHNGQAVRHIWTIARGYERPVMVALGVSFEGTPKEYEYLFIVEHVPATIFPYEDLVDAVKYRIGPSWPKSIQNIRVKDVWLLNPGNSSFGEKLLNMLYEDLKVESMSDCSGQTVTIGGKEYVLHPRHVW